MINRKELKDTWAVRSAGVQACLVAACDLADVLGPALPEGWESRYDVSGEQLTVFNRDETKGEKSVLEFKFITTLINGALGKKPYHSEVFGTEAAFTLSRAWSSITVYPEAGMYGFYSVYLAMSNPKDCIPKVTRESVTTERETLSLGDVCLGFKED